MPRRGGGWPRETVLTHSGKPTPPRFARLPLPEEGARMIFKETLIQSLPFAVRDSRSPHMCRAPLRFPHLSFIPLEPYPPLRGTFPTRGRLVCREYHPLKKAAKPPPYKPSLHGEGGPRQRRAAAFVCRTNAPLFFPPSFGRRCPEGAEVGRVKRYSHIRGNQPRLASLVCPFQRKGRE